MPNYDLIIPVRIVFQNLSMEVPFQFSENIYLIELSSYFENVHTSEHGPLKDIIQLSRNKYAIAIMKFDSCDDQLPHHFDNSNYRKAFQKFLYFLIAIWSNNKHIPIFRDVFIFKTISGTNKKEPVYSADRSGIIIQNRVDSIIDNDALINVKLFLDNVIKLKEEDKLLIPVNLTLLSLKQELRNLKYIFLWITLESLFGVSNAELNFRLSQSIALFLSKGDPEADLKLFNELKKTYDIRSCLVHGEDVSDNDLKFIEGLELLNRTVKASLKKIFSSENIFNVFNSKIDKQQFLEKMAFKFLMN